MPTEELSPAPPKPTLPPFWKGLMRVTFAVTLLLFLTPTFYALKYYIIDKPREDALQAGTLNDPALPHADYLPRLERHARDADPAARQQAVTRIGTVLREPYISLKRPIECLSAKATLSSLAARDPDPAVRAAASEELGKVAQGGAVIRR